MARVGTNLFLRKTLRASSSTTFNSPGNYLPPYGSTVIQIGGRGASGNPSTGGNYAGTNPGSPGNYAGSNPPTVSGHNYGTYNWYSSVHYSYSPSPPGLGPNHFSQSSSGSNMPGPYSHHGADPDPPYGYGQYFHGSINYSQTGYNGSANYTPGNPNYNPYSPGHAYYNPTVPGNSGTPANIEGVSFPGGPAGSTAPTVPYTSTTLVYTGSSISITVPSGGYVDIRNI